jgi:hypothetical protein
VPAAVEDSFGAGVRLLDGLHTIVGQETPDRPRPS